MDRSRKAADHVVNKVRVSIGMPRPKVRTQRIVVCCSGASLSQTLNHTVRRLRVQVAAKAAMQLTHSQGARPLEIPLRGCDLVLLFSSGEYVSCTGTVAVAWLQRAHPTEVGCPRIPLVSKSVSTVPQLPHRHMLACPRWISATGSPGSSNTLSHSEGFKTNACPECGPVGRMPGTASTLPSTGSNASSVSAPATKVSLPKPAVKPTRLTGTQAPSSGPSSKTSWLSRTNTSLASSPATKTPESRLEITLRAT